VLKELSWEPTKPLAIPEATNALQQLTFFFDRDLDPRSVEGRAEQIVTAWFSTDQALSGARVVRGTTAIDGNEVIWRPDPADVKTLLPAARETGGTVLLDLNCDFVLDRDGQPASACSSTLLGVHLPRPGGIMRTWLQVLRG
jgi:hypothetical protein